MQTVAERIQGILEQYEADERFKKASDAEKIAGYERLRDYVQETYDTIMLDITQEKTNNRITDKEAERLAHQASNEAKQYLTVVTEKVQAQKQNAWVPPAVSANQPLPPVPPSPRPSQRHDEPVFVRTRDNRQAMTMFGHPPMPLQEIMHYYHDFAESRYRAPRNDIHYQPTWEKASANNFMLVVALNTFSDVIQFMHGIFMRQLMNSIDTQMSALANSFEAPTYQRPGLH